MALRQHLSADESISHASLRDAGPAPENHPGSADNDLESLDDVPPPAYGEIYGQIDGGEEHRGTNANVTGAST